MRVVQITDTHVPLDPADPAAQVAELSRALDEQRARAEVLEWRHAGEELRGRPPAEHGQPEQTGST